MKITFDYHKSALSNCSHGQRQPTKWMPITFKWVNMNYYSPFDGKFVGRRLWWYTKSGGRMAEIIIKLQDAEVQ